VELLDQETRESQVVLPIRETDLERAELAARRSLRTQIAKLERELAEAFVTAYPMGGFGQEPEPSARDPRLLDLGELERVRDELAERLHAARVTISERAEVQAANRRYLEQMLLEPAKHRFARVSCRDLGEPGCGVWQVRPRLGLIGMMMGWWQVKLSSGCPLPRGRGLRSRPGRTTEEPVVRDPLRTGLGALLVLLIMFTGSLVMWIGAPLLWLWVGGQIQGASGSVGAAIGAAFLGAVLTIVLVAGLLSKLSNVYRANQRARGRDDPGHFVLEAVLVTSAGLALVAFLVWFFIFAGAEPLPFAGSNG
jgi:hypothetical protein